MDDQVTRQLGWRDVLQTYPCQHCGAPAGKPCRTKVGLVAATPHVSRAGAAARCHECGDRLPADHQRDLCGYCAMVKKLTLERYRPGDLDV